MHERIKKLRKALDLTQQEFADRIGVKRNTIANYETGRNNPVDSIISLICREFNVNEEWLRTGNGEMFKAAPSDALDSLAATYNLTHGEYILIEKFVNMKPDSRQVIMEYLLEVSSAITGSDVSSDIHAYSDEIDIDAEVAAYRAELEVQEKAKAKSSVSDGHSGTDKEKMA